jgi:hypothetical protein
MIEDVGLRSTRLKTFDDPLMIRGAIGGYVIGITLRGSSAPRCR